MAATAGRWRRVVEHEVPAVAERDLAPKLVSPTPPRSASGVTVSASGSTAHSVERFGVAQ